MKGALSGIRIIEVSQVLAAPFCGYQFALLGADVVKVEVPDLPDCARGRGPVDSLNAAGLGLTYQVQGGNKRSLALDIRDPRGRDTLLRLVAGADVFLENYSTGTLDALGLGYDHLRACNPAIVHCSMTGYGEQRVKGAYDNTIQAASGIVGQCGGVKPGVSFVDYAAGYSAAFAIAAALLRRMRDGVGCHIDASMLDVALSLMAPEVAARQVAPDAGRRQEAGLGSYDAADGRLMLGAFKPSQYRKLGACLSSIGQPVTALSAITDWAGVWSQSPAIRPALDAIFRERPVAEWLFLLEAADVPVEPIRSLDEALVGIGAATAGYFAPSPVDPALPLPLAAFRLSAGGAALHSAPPALGQDSRAILTEAGLTQSAIEALFAAQVAR